MAGKDYSFFRTSFFRIVHNSIEFFNEYLEVYNRLKTFKTTLFLHKEYNVKEIKDRQEKLENGATYFYAENPTGRNLAKITIDKNRPFNSSIESFFVIYKYVLKVSKIKIRKIV
jgi:hypothetical protein